MTLFAELVAEELEWLDSKKSVQIWTQHLQIAYNEQWNVPIMLNLMLLIYQTMSHNEKVATNQFKASWPSAWKSCTVAMIQLCVTETEDKKLLKYPWSLMVYYHYQWPL